MKLNHPLNIPCSIMVPLGPVEDRIGYSRRRPSIQIVSSKAALTDEIGIRH